jgi:hypothetical protein
MSSGRTGDPESRTAIGSAIKRSPVKAKKNSSCTYWDRCYDFLNIFAEKFSEKFGAFDSRQS